MQSLKEELLDLLFLLETLNPVQLQALCQFVQNNSSGKYELWIPQLIALLQKVSMEQLEILSASTLQLEEDEEQHDKDLEPIASEFSFTLSDLRTTFSLLMSLHHLQQLLQQLSILQLMKFFETIPSGPPIQQLQLIQQIQQLFGQLQPEALQNLHSRISQTEPGQEQQTLSQLLNLPSEFFHLYQPLKMLLQLDEVELLKLQGSLPKLQPPQILQLLQLLQLQPFDVLELRNLLNPTDSFAFDQEMSMDTEPTSEGPDVAPLPPSSDKQISLQIVEQPPEKSVYKRNLRPNPMVALVGDQKLNDGNLYIAVTLVRCDTFTEEPKFLTGNKPVRVTTGRVVTFKKLKITTTSHQQQETLFCLKFEIRRYRGDEEYEVYSTIHSNPICVLSHSTQMKPVAGIVPTLHEIIPNVGPTAGGTRVAVLGNNFVDSPSARVRFDNTDVMPSFHGPGTFICHSPQHPPGSVIVRVCNSPKKWSEQTTVFTYDDSIDSIADQVQLAALNKQPSSDDSTITRAAWQGGQQGFESVRRLQSAGVDVNSVDDRSFTALHYASALGDNELCYFLLEHGADVNYQDKYGATALHWACHGGHSNVVQTLIAHGAVVNIPTFEGHTPLFVTAMQDHEDILPFLLESGAYVHYAGVDGETVLHLACAGGRVSTVKNLLKYGANVHAVDDFGDTCLHWAIREGHLEVIALLLQQGAEVDSGVEESPLHLAATLGEKKVVDMLIRHGASLNVQDMEKSTPLLEAVCHGHRDIVTMLVESGADVHAKDITGETALSHWRRNHGVDQMFSYLNVAKNSGGFEEQANLQDNTRFAKTGKISIRPSYEKGSFMRRLFNVGLSTTTV